MIFKLSLVALVACAFAVTGEQFSFEGYKVWLVQTNSEAQQKLLAEWQNNEGIDFWEPLPALGKSVRIMVSPNTQADFADFLSANNIPNDLIIENVETIFAEERKYDETYRLQKRLLPRTSRHVSDFNHYWDLQEIHEYLDFLERRHSDLVSTEVIGTSIDGRPLRLVNISLTGRGQVNGSRPIVFYDAGIHAREWVAPHAGLYILKQLVENREENREILEQLDFVILPIVNPDGYQYSKDTYRMWRKNRRPLPVDSLGRRCFGVDGNRNYAYMWQPANMSNPNAFCGETYSGTGPFSEPETQAVQLVIDRHSTDIKVYVSFHTYGNYVLYPWGFERTLIDNWQLHDRIGRVFGDSIFEATGTNYTVGNSAIALYPAPGGSDDYTAFAGVQASFTFELTGGGQRGFDLPAYQLHGVVQETWLGFRNVLLLAAERNWDELD